MCFQHNKLVGFPDYKIGFIFIFILWVHLHIGGWVQGEEIRMMSSSHLHVMYMCIMDYIIDEKRLDDELQ